MNRLVLSLALLATSLPGFAQSQEPAPTDAPKIEDNSFLMEEAYNQEFGVVQHIQTFTRDLRNDAYVYSFTQEWPVDVDPRHQLSYTLQGTRAEGFEGFGWGDTLLNYRFQLVKGERLAIAPRASVIFPSGDSRFGRGFGGAGFQTNWALSFKAKKKLTMHSNAGWTIVPNAKNDLGQKAQINEFNLGQSFIWLAKPRFNVLLETVYNSSQDVMAPDRGDRVHDVTMNPGVRWAYNLKSGMQIVPGISIPTGVGPSAGQVGVLFYFSIEHSYRKKKD
jgi:hypothetical protein